MVWSVVCVFLVGSFVLTETQLRHDARYQWLTIALPQENKYLKLEDLDIYNSIMGVQFYFYAPDPVRSTAT
jgi:hypothetical protein